MFFILRSQPKICITLVIAASLEVEHGISNLWRSGPSYDGFKAHPDYGQYIPEAYFRGFVNGFPHLWSPEDLWYSEYVPWDAFRPFVMAFNRKRNDLLKTVYLLMDESMSAWRPKTSQTGGLPNITFEPRKPKPLGTMFKNGVEATTGIMVTQDVVEGSAAQWEKKWVGDQSSLPKKEPIMAHVAEVLRQCEGAKLADGGWVGGDAWFGSIPAVVELKKRLNVFSTFIVKQNVQYCPMQVIQKILRTRHPKRPAGHHVVMKATISGVELFLLAYAWSNKRAAYILSSCGTTVPHEINYRTHFTDDFGNVTFKEIPRPSIAHFYFELSPLIDNHNKDRQGILGLEDCWPTKNPWFRLMTTLIGMCVVDLHRWDRSKRSGGKAFDWVNEDEDRPDFLKVRSMANMIARGLHYPRMRYYSFSRPRSTAINRRDGYVKKPLERITNDDGEIRRQDGGREYQKACFICRVYQKKQVNVVWRCSSCQMPLCKKNRGRKLSCLEEHQHYCDDKVVGCHKDRRSFVLPMEYRKWGKKESCFDDNEESEAEDDDDEGMDGNESDSAAVSDLESVDSAPKIDNTKKRGRKAIRSGMVPNKAVTRMQTTDLRRSSRPRRVVGV